MVLLSLIFENFGGKLLCKVNCAVGFSTQIFVETSMVLAVFSLF